MPHSSFACPKMVSFLANRFCWGRVGRRLFLSFRFGAEHGQRTNRKLDRISPIPERNKNSFMSNPFFPLALQKGNIWVAPGINHLQKRKAGTKGAPGIRFSSPLLGKGVIHLSRETRGFLHMQHGVAWCSTENKCSSLSKTETAPEQRENERRKLFQPISSHALIFPCSSNSVFQRFFQQRKSW